jgi:hypothetical protein
VTLDVPAGTIKWSASVTLTGSLPAGTTHDFRTQGVPDQPTVIFPSAGQIPIAVVAGETGGPNDCLLTSTSTTPNSSFVGGGFGCRRDPLEPGECPSRYALSCYDGFYASIESVARDVDGRITGYEAPVVRSPQGTGSASLSGFAYDALGRPTGWTEERRFDASGRTHHLVFTGIEYFAGGYVKAYRVVHTGPDGIARTYDYAPFR